MEGNKDRWAARPVVRIDKVTRYHSIADCAKELYVGKSTVCKWLNEGIRSSIVDEAQRARAPWWTLEWKGGEA